MNKRVKTLKKQIDERQAKIGVIGLGYVGLPLAVEFANAGFQVTGIDVERAPQTYDRLAHVGGCGVVTNLIEARERGLLHDGATVALYAQGAGFTRSVALVRWAQR